MCGRTTLTITPDDLQRTFGYEVPPDYRPRFNIAPTQQVLALAEEGEARGFRTFRWGLVPFWAKDPAIGNRMINARAETVTEKPAFRASFAKRRCLIVVDGFYEWQASPGGKRPHRICLRSRTAFTIAGLWDRWDAGAQTLESCTILTIGADGAMSDVHERMPVIVEEANRATWLTASSSAEELKPMLRPYRRDDLEIYEVSTLVNSPANDRPECIEPVGSPLPFA